MPSADVCTETAANGAPAPATYRETAFDRFGPLDPAPALTIEFGHDRISDPIVLRATRVEGGVLVSASRSPNLPSRPDDRLPVVAIDHDGTVRWSRCLEGSREIQTVVAAPEFRPATALVVVLTANHPEYEYRIVQLSLATGVEQPTFAAAMRSLGFLADDLVGLGVADVTDRYVLFVDNVAVPGATYERIVRYDLVADVAIDVGVPAELAQNQTIGPCSGALQPSLSGSGNVIVSNLTTDVLSVAPEPNATGPVVALWHDGTWSREPTLLARAVGVLPGFACADNPTAMVVRGVDALGDVRWTDSDLTHPGADDVGWYLDGDVAVGSVCSRRIDDECDRFEFVGLDPATGEIRWTQPGLRLVAGDPADGHVLVSAESTGDVLEPPGWVLLDDRTGREVPGQSWDDPELFTLYPSREVSGFNRTVRAGGLVLVVQGDQLQVWYPKATGGEPRSVLLP
jgi:hypothetical protein